MQLPKRVCTPEGERYQTYVSYTVRVLQVAINVPRTDRLPTKVLQRPPVLLTVKITKETHKILLKLYILFKFLHYACLLIYPNFFGIFRNSEVPEVTRKCRISGESF